MRAYVLVTGIVFGLIVVAHAWRLIAEGTNLHAEFFALTLFAAALCGWAATLLLRRRGTP